MKKTNLFMRTFSVVCALAVMVMVNSCYDDTDLKNSIDDLTGRVEELEKFREDVQSEISSLNAIIAALQENVTVDNVVSNEDGSYTINFSDGTSVTIKDGENGANGLTPPSIIVVEEDGVYYWAYENADGTTEFITDDDGERIPVTGVAPQVRINEDGFWEISTDGGQTWEETGMPSTGGSGDSIFTSVEDGDDSVTFTLRDGTVIVVPKTAELIFEFVTEDEVISVAYGMSVTLQCRMSGASEYTIQKPDGWRASIEGEGTEFVITAPVKENIYAEKEGTVSVLIVSAHGQSFVAEINVKAVEYVEPVLTLLSDEEVVFARGGGNTVVSYSIENGWADGEISAESTVDWLSFDTSVQGSVTVIALENAEEEERTAVVTVTYTYGDTQTQSFEVSVTQSVYDYELNATILSGSYFGDDYSAVDGEMIYALFIQDTPQYWIAGHNYYYIGLKAGEPGDMGAIAPPVGTYTASQSEGYDANGMFKIMKNGSGNYMTCGYVNGATRRQFNSGEITVSKVGVDYMLEGVLVDIYGDTHHFTYTGPISLQDARTEPEPEPDAISLLTDDLTIDWPNAMLASAYYWGDNRWTIDIREQYDYNHSVQIEFYAEGTPTSLDGLPASTFTMADTKEIGTALIGTLSQSTFGGATCSGSWVYNRNGSAYSGEAAPFVNGEVTISRDGNNHTVTVDVYDDAANKITVNASFTATAINIIDLSSW